MEKEINDTMSFPLLLFNQKKCMHEKLENIREFNASTDQTCYSEPLLANNRNPRLINLGKMDLLFT